MKWTDEYLRRKIRKLEKVAARHRYNPRPGVYQYLHAVYELYVELRSRRIARKATRRIAKLAKLPIRKDSYAIRILIEASAGPEDNRQKSRWTQALRYAWGWRQRPHRLKWFFQVNGGIAGSAAKRAVRDGTCRGKLVCRVN